MELLLYLIENSISFLIASIPLILVFFNFIIFKSSLSKTLVDLVLILAISVFFWIKVKDIYLILYQLVPYISALVCICCKYHSIKKTKFKAETENDTRDGDK